jgi:hypothetical protein
MNTTISIHADELDLAGLLGLSWDLAYDGFEGREPSIRQVVRSARAARVSPVLIDVLRDPSAPEVARLRAFGRIAAALAAAPLATGEHDPAAAA